MLAVLIGTRLYGDGHGRRELFLDVAQFELGLGTGGVTSQEAREVLRTVRIGNATPNVLIVRGDLELAAGRASKAIRLYKRARHLGPTLADPWVALAKAELTRSRPDRARSDLLRALKLEPNNADALELLRQLDRKPEPKSPH
jgi:predicted Zn-dependent protease